MPEITQPPGAPVTSEPPLRESLGWFTTILGWLGLG